MSAILGTLGTGSHFVLVARLATGRVASARGPLATLPILPLLSVLEVTPPSAWMGKILSPMWLHVGRLSQRQYCLIHCHKGTPETVVGERGRIALELQRLARDMPRPAEP
jgi:hypothetical protein